MHGIKSLCRFGCGFFNKKSYFAVPYAQAQGTAPFFACHVAAQHYHFGTAKFFLKNKL